MSRKILATAVAVALFTVVFVARVRATRHSHVAPAASANLAKTAGSGALAVQQYYPLMVITARQPLEIPGRVLPPGDYSFRLLNSGAHVSIARLDGSESYGVFPILVAWRDNAADGLVQLAGSSDGRNRLSSWYFPGEKNGYAFDYLQAQVQ